MKKPRKTKVLHFTGERFTIATTVHGAGKKRTLHGLPRIRVSSNSVTVGCMYLTNAAIDELFRIRHAGIKAAPLPDGLYQEDNYRSAEE